MTAKPHAADVPATSAAAQPLPLSVVVPVHNEADNVATLVAEIDSALTGVCDFEMVFVNDASKDNTLAVLQTLCQRYTNLRVLCHARQSGQSTAVRNGVAHARGVWIVTLDGDGQNNPKDIPQLLAQRDAFARPACFAGWRRDRRDTLLKRLSSKVANAVRSALLRDATPDSGCGIKLFPRAAFLALPYFDHMHRFLPALFARAGLPTHSVTVSHRARIAGVSKYGLWNRLWVGIVDIVGVAWLQRRAKLTEVSEISTLNAAAHTHE
jgi:dolichol-phosphate mannosyltransferase